MQLLSAAHLPPKNIKNQPKKILIISQKRAFLNFFFFKKTCVIFLEMKLCNFQPQPFFLQESTLKKLFYFSSKGSICYTSQNDTLHSPSQSPKKLKNIHPKIFFDISGNRTVLLKYLKKILYFFQRKNFCYISKKIKPSCISDN